MVVFLMPVIIVEILTVVLAQAFGVTQLIQH
jgi:hypothetical protein